MSTTRVLRFHTARYILVALSACIGIWLLYGPIRFIINDGLSWKTASMLLLCVLFAAPFALVIYASVKHRYKDFVSVVAVLSSIIIFVMVQIVFDRADLANIIVGKGPADLHLAFAYMMLDNLGLTVGAFLSVYIWQVLVRYGNLHIPDVQKIES